MFVRKRKEINQGKDAKGEICLPKFDLLSERACRPGVCWLVAQCVQNGVYKKSDAFDTVISA